MNMTKSVQQFLLKLFNMVSDPSTDDLIRWSPAGNTFLVIDHEELAKQVLCIEILLICASTEHVRVL
ncbi:hypothetical protein HMI55_005775 [Coelomomyces lativittatus]|nr:hypothetical protein HMI55_005775 [Coelomomyces lativittatus]